MDKLSCIKMDRKGKLFVILGLSSNFFSFGTKMTNGQDSDLIETTSVGSCTTLEHFSFPLTIM